VNAVTTIYYAIAYSITWTWDTTVWVTTGTWNAIYGTASWTGNVTMILVDFWVDIGISFFVFAYDASFAISSFNWELFVAALKLLLETSYNITKLTFSSIRYLFEFAFYAVERTLTFLYFVGLTVFGVIWSAVSQILAYLFEVLIIQPLNWLFFRFIDFLIFLNDRIFLGGLEILYNAVTGFF